MKGREEKVERHLTIGGKSFKSNVTFIAYDWFYRSR